MLELNQETKKYYKKIFIATLLGMSSGLPLYVLYQTIPAWLKDAGVDLSDIGLFQLIGIPYTIKFLWAPLLDRYRFPFLGQRRSWMFVTQLLLILSIASIGFFSPQNQISTIVMLTVIMTTFSATQDIVIDAYRRELLSDEELGAGNAWFVNAYRFSSLVPGSLALVLADRIDWQYVFPIVALFMLVGLVTTLFIPEHDIKHDNNKTLAQSIVEPLAEYFSRFSYKHGILILVFLMLYKLGDSMATALSTPFYLDMGYSKTVLGTVVKAAALWSTVAGAFIAGIVMRKISLNKSLWLFGFFQMLTILGFAWLSQLQNPSNTALFIVVSLEYLGVGMGTVAVISFMFKISNKSFAAAQIALFTAITAVPRTFINASTGYIIERVGYFDFFLICTACAIPGMLLLFVIAPWKE
ncbi:MAG: AmpG family muropeptide MFS transporter [Gammaproteobacteria bacterium]|jgi:PAT family beta-lactamase induction signal transducer AmpG|nr:AmpG family muropeptide MFS transporter [Xanthomonadales bacterium]